MEGFLSSSCLPLTIATVAVSLASYLAYKHYSIPSEKSPVNPCIKKDCPKIVDTFDVEDLSDKTVFCRCWRSKKFPYCDGSHNDYNKGCGDNVGPIIIQKK